MSFMEMSVLEEMGVRAKEWGSEGYCHHFPTDAQHLALVYTFCAQRVPDFRFKADVEEIEELKKIQFDCEGFIESRSFTDGLERESFWNDSGMNNNYVLLRPMNGTITTVDGAKFKLWTVSRWSDDRGADILYTLLSYKPEDVAKFEHFSRLLTHLKNSIDKRTKTIQVYGGSDVKIGTQQSWEDLILAPDVLEATKTDIEGWIRNEDRYRKMRVPYRRGYLFEGPPGNGKTAVARTIISTYGFSAFEVDFSNPDLTDGELRKAFAQAADAAPSIFLLEDLDRLDPQSTRVSMKGILNCLDGAATFDGVVSIVTANNPEVLDKAIRMRPGRFDVPVRFDNPDTDQRHRYVNYVLKRGETVGITPETISTVVERTNGMSMAYLKSIFELATFATLGDITNEGIIQATDRAEHFFQKMKTAKERPAGFCETEKPRNQAGFGWDTMVKPGDEMNQSRKLQGGSNLDP